MTRSGRNKLLAGVSVTGLLASLIMLLAPPPTSGVGLVTQSGPRWTASGSSSSSSSSSSGGPAWFSTTWDGGTNGASIGGTGIGARGSVYDSSVFFGASGKSAKSIFVGGSDGDSSGFGWDYPSALPRFSEIWARWRVNYESGFDFTTDSHLKIFRFHVRNSGGGNVGYNDLYISGGNSTSVGSYDICSETALPDGQCDDGPATGLVRGTWQTIELYVKFDTVSVNSGGQGRMRLWVNNTMVFEDTDIETMRNTTDLSDFIFVYTFWNRVAGVPHTQNAWIDDFQVYSNVGGAPGNTDSGGRPCICGT